jgi:hypothetical protein
MIGKVTNLLGVPKGARGRDFLPFALPLASQERVCSVILIQLCAVNKTVKVKQFLYWPGQVLRIPGV